MPGGRPREIPDNLIEKTKDYIENFHKHDDLIPSAASLACFLGFSKSTIYKWADEIPEFSDTLKYLQSVQEKFLLRGGLSGDFNATISKLALANHGYSDKQEVQQDITSKGNEITGFKLEIVDPKDNQDSKVVD